MERFSWLKCAVSEGMLADEYAVECRDANDSQISFFAPSTLVNIAKNLVRVRELDCKEDYCLIYLPMPPMENSGRTVCVKKEQLQVA
ncbi:MAG: hypothetical protein WA666_07595 [Nitrospirota bacterium]